MVRHVPISTDISGPSEWLLVCALDQHRVDRWSYSGGMRVLVSFPPGFSKHLTIIMGNVKNGRKA